MDEPEACPACGRPLAPRQEFCLECGSRVQRPRGLVAALARGWRRRLPGYPGDWIWPSLGALAIAAGGAAAAIAATGGTESAAPRTLTALSELREPATTVAGRPSRVGSWPRQNGFTIALAIFPVGDGGGAARDRARRAVRAGLPQVGILLSSNFASLHPGYYVVFSGVYASREDAEAALPPASRRFPNAAVRQVAR